MYLRKQQRNAPQRLSPPVRPGSCDSVRLACCVITMVCAAGVRGPMAHADDTVINPTLGQPGEPLPYEDGPVGQRVDLGDATTPIEQRVEHILGQLSLEEKIGQLNQRAVGGEALPAKEAADLRSGRIGSLFYTGSRAQTLEAQRIAIKESRLGLPLLAPRDVIHGFRTVFPIPLGQAASWNPPLVEQASAIAAQEARSEGVNWTFAPMMDVARDPRWGRIAESTGEDPYLAGEMAQAMVNGLQQVKTADGAGLRVDGVMACAKHFAAYGLAEGGRDYNRAQVSGGDLHSIYLHPFREAVDAGCLSVMTSFNTINGVPATGHRGLVRGVLKDAWGFDGIVVSDWGSVLEMIEHGYAEDERSAAALALSAGVDIEMASTTYQQHLADLVQDGVVAESQIDDAVRRVLRMKLLMARSAETEPAGVSPPTDATRAVSRELARQSCVLLKNDNLLPLDPAAIKRIAIIGPLADAPRDQLGCWMLDGKPEEAVTLASALRQRLEPRVETVLAPGAASSTSTDVSMLQEAVAAARRADIVVVCVGESWTLSGEARNRVSLNLPGVQEQLVREVAATGVPLVMVVMAGRPLSIGEQTRLADAVLYAWHPGTMGGPAIVDLLLGEHSPSGKLPVTFPQHVGQVPLYYNHPNTGRPALAETRALIGSDLEDFPEPQKFRSHYLDATPFPLFPFGYGLSYGQFVYSDLRLTEERLRPGETLHVSIQLSNHGRLPAEEVAQLYVRDVTAKLVRPVRELKGFQRVRLAPGATAEVTFQLSAKQLAYYDNDGNLQLEPGRFKVGVGSDSTAPFAAEFLLTN